MTRHDLRPLQTLVFDAITVAPQAFPYVASRQFRAWAGARPVLTTKDGRFDVDRFALAGRCAVQHALVPTPRVDTAWDGEERRVEQTRMDGYFTVTWEGETIDVLRISVPNDYAATTFSFLAGSSDVLLRRFFEAVCTFEDALGDAILVFANGCWNRSKQLFAELRATRFEDLVLEPALASRMRADFRDFLASKDEYARYGVPWKRGALFVGPPGNGKTGAIKALVNDLGLSCVYVQSFRGERGRSDERNVRAVFAYAREIAPCVVVLEDLDSLVTADTRSYFLNELDGFARNAGLVTLASTNHPDKLDPAIVDRPSRFDRKYHFPLPALAERTRYLAHWNARLAEAARLSETDRRAVAAATEGYSFAYLKELIVASLMRLPEARREGRAFVDVLLAEQRTLRAQMSSAEVVPETRAVAFDDDMVT
jgi:hypothetical protein